MSEIGWVIEDGSSSPADPVYWSGPLHWTKDHLEAVRFCREIDAKRVNDRLEQGIFNRVCEHAWG